MTGRTKTSTDGFDHAATGRAFDYESAKVEPLARVTIITPYRDASVLIHETARSILNQSFQHWRWLIIGGNWSEAKALSVLRGYADRDPRIQVIDHTTNQSVADACHAAFKEAWTEYVVHLDSGGLPEPTALERLYWFLESHPETDSVTWSAAKIKSSWNAEKEPKVRGGAAESDSPRMIRRPSHRRSPSHAPRYSVLDELPCDNRLLKRKPRLLMLVPWMDMGGADKFNLDLVSHLTRQGWEVTIVATLAGDQSWMPYFARYTPDIFILRDFLRLEDYPRFLRYLMQSRQIDVVMVSNSELGYLLLPYLCAHFPKVTFTDFCHIEEHWKNGGYPRMAIESQNLLDLNIVASEHLKRWMIERGAESGKIRVNYLGVDPLDWRPNPERRALVRRELGLDEDVPVILFAGRICLQKQPRVLAATILRLGQQGLRFSVLVAGDGPDFAWLRKFIDKQRMHEQVRLLGAVTIERMQQLISAADIFFLPSQWEGIALSIYEAMAAGLPIVGAAVGGQRELVTPDCGVLIDRGTEGTEARQYAEILAELLQDPQRRARMGAAGRSRISSRFQLEQMGKKMVRLLNEARNLHENRGCSGLSLRKGSACAAEALRYIHLVQSAETLHSEPALHLQVAALFYPVHWRAGAYAMLRWAYDPFYRRGVKRGGAWYFPVAGKIKQMLLGVR